MRSIWKMAAALTGLLLTFGCASLTGQRDVDALDAAQPTGSAFTQRLTEEYRHYADYQWKHELDYRNGAYFARKGLRTAGGEAVPPEDLASWNLPQAGAGELGTQRARLASALSAGAADRDPQDAAVAQERFDCWVEEQEENTDANDIRVCRDDFMHAMGAIEGGMAPAQAPVYLVFFDFNKATITPAAEKILDTVVADVRKGNIQHIDISGYTDTVGSAEYNLKLSEQRANAVRDALVRKGLPVAEIKTEGFGKTHLLVQTGDQVREPSNRRAEIRFQ